MLVFDLKVALFYFAALISYNLRGKIDCHNHKIANRIIFVGLFISICFIMLIKKCIPINTFPTASLANILVHDGLSGFRENLLSLLWFEMIPFLILIPVLGKLHDKSTENIKTESKSYQPELLYWIKKLVELIKTFGNKFPLIKKLQWNEIEFTLICYVFLPLSWWELFWRMEKTNYFSPIFFGVGYEISRFLESYLRNKNDGK